MEAREEITKMFTHTEWDAVIERLKGLVYSIADGVFKENSKMQIGLICEAINRIAEESIHADSYTLNMHSLQIMHDALMGQYYEESQLQFLTDFISQFLKKNPRILGRVADTDIKNGHYDIPFGVTSIGDEAFRNCISLTAVTIPSSVASMGYRAFFGCASLTAVTIPCGMTSIGHGAFFGCTGLTAVTMPSSVTSIGDAAFMGCTGLTALTILSGVTFMGDSAFWDCPGLTAIIITASSKEEYQRILQILPADLQQIAIETESLKEKTTLTISAFKSGQGFFMDMSPEITGTIIAKLAQLHGQPQVDELSAMRLTKS